MRKYGNTQVTVGGIVFDSQKEAYRWCELQMLERGKAIRDLQRQGPYQLMPNQRDENGQLIERAVKYVADFVYTDCKTGRMVVEDTKGMKTKDYIIKRKLMLYIHGIRIREV